MTALTDYIETLKQRKDEYDGVAEEYYQDIENAEIADIWCAKSTVLQQVINELTELRDKHLTDTVRTHVCNSPGIAHNLD